MIFPNSHTPFIYNKKTDINPWCDNPLHLRKKLLQFKCNYFLIFNELDSSRLLSIYKNFTLVNKFSFKDLKLNSDKYFYGKNVRINQLELLLFKNNIF